MTHALAPAAATLADLLTASTPRPPDAVRANVGSHDIFIQARNGNAHDVVAWARLLKADVRLVVQQSLVRLSTATQVDKVHIEVWTHLPLPVALQVFARWGQTPQLGEPVDFTGHDLDHLVAVAGAVA
ncbi:hypothetical protein [Labedaea rhizosphaerae]|uniref:Uncharacterized protein n=1 Tax=Labedaea rhizosphaerae TaxID=598644 RepID=A0A4R6SI17_LABRH|nr:hypothetical protein [Labedaea rhizosphaerae]TDQ01293.1 hypothetical protein EV186_1021161 [Labedaea rhizosphaerae]